MCNDLASRMCTVSVRNIQGPSCHETSPLFLSLFILLCLRHLCLCSLGHVPDGRHGPSRGWTDCHLPEAAEQIQHYQHDLPHCEAIGGGMGSGDGVCAWQNHPRPME